MARRQGQARGAGSLPGQRGQAALAVALLALALLIGVGLVARWGQAALAGSRAQAAADAAALATLNAADPAAIAEGALPTRIAAAAAVADAGGTLIDFEVALSENERAPASEPEAEALETVLTVAVTVELDGQRASAAAAAPVQGLQPAGHPNPPERP